MAKEVSRGAIACVRRILVCLRPKTVAEAGILEHGKGMFASGAVEALSYAVLFLHVRY